MWVWYFYSAMGSVPDATVGERITLIGAGVERATLTGTGTERLTEQGTGVERISLTGRS
jgi:hypothetical protein